MSSYPKSWIQSHVSLQFLLFKKGELFSEQCHAFDRLNSFDEVKEACVYLLVMGKKEESLIVYVGLTTRLIKTRWNQHLKELYEQKKDSYKAWKTCLFENEVAKQDTYLFIIQQKDVSSSPVHHIPHPSANQLEKELISLLDLYQPHTLLNYEGKSRQTVDNQSKSFFNPQALDQILLERSTMLSHSDLCDWLQSLPKHSFVTLFEQNDDGSVKIKEKVSRKYGKKTLICRHPEMEKAIIHTVSEGLNGEYKDQWQGLIYIMGRGSLDHFEILYVGKADKLGTKSKLSANIKGVDKGGNKSYFARWGDGLAYHIGDLSQAVFGNKGYKEASPKYLRWKDELFEIKEDGTLWLKDGPITFYIAPWYSHSISFSGLPMHLAGVEYDLIALSSVLNPNLLNEDGISKINKQQSTQSIKLQNI